MKKGLKLFCGALLSTLLISCGSSNESVVEKYLPGTYTRQHKEGEDIGFGYNKELTIKHLKGNEYRIICQAKDDKDTKYVSGEKITKFTPRTPDIYDIEISSVELTQKSDSISEYYIRGFVTNVIENGTSFSSANSGINESEGITLIIGKNIIEVTLAGNSLSSIRNK